MNWCAKREHVPRIERKIRVIKERLRGYMSAMTCYKKFPKPVVIEMVKEISKWLNIFPVTNSVSDLYSPGTIVTSRKLNYNADCRIQFGQAVELHDHPDGLQLNSVMHPRTTTAIALGGMGNAQGGYKFFSLRKGRNVTGYKWTEIPVNDLII